MVDLDNESSKNYRKTLAPKSFEIQTWDWSRMKDFLKIFQNVIFENS